ncbi:MAG: DUF4381 domain-containing protein [Pseudoalteromonas sp.]|uniref:DUF4381 domain-containing protein n=1 Tax=unclassified Pseudoalteromonas TaxID=194690 RepID=UPI003F9D0353
MQTSPLDGLHDVIAPNQVHWWPLAPAWWALIVLILMAIIGLGYYLYKRSQFIKAKRHAVELSQQLGNDPQQLHVLIKRLVLHYYNPQAASSETQKWCQTLKALSDIEFTERELLSLYQAGNESAKLCDKFRLAIKQFKLKEPLNV